jgi:hypothetical protein
MPARGTKEYGVLLDGMYRPTEHGCEDQGLERDSLRLDQIITMSKQK